MKTRASNPDRQRFRNEDLVLQVSTAFDRSKWREDRYEPFLDQLCGTREYQKDAIRVALRYVLGGEYRNLRDLAKENFDTSPSLEARYGSFPNMERHLQLPDQLSASLDLATGTGKSYVLYGLAVILLAEGTVDRVVVLCPSTTIERELLSKFRSLAGDSDLRSLLPTDAAISAPEIMDANQTIVPGAICVENYHAVLQHVGSSVRDSLDGIGAQVAILNDEAHHVVNETASHVKSWKEFLLDPSFGFRIVIGVSGTPYVADDYFSDVIFRYSLRQAIEEKYVKSVDYVAEMPRTNDPDEKWQLILNRHEDIRTTLRRRGIRPLTIVITRSIASCKDVAEELSSYLVTDGGLTAKQVDQRVLVVYNNAPGVLELPRVNSPSSEVEWIISVSMLNEGWDVERVFQIVPHEERAFNSKLLIAQVLGRGLRVPKGWQGDQPRVTVFNHDSWATRIRYLVNEILEIEKRLSSHVLSDSPFHFELHNIDYRLEPTSVKKPMVGEYTLFAKGYVDLATDSPAEEVSIQFERATTGEQFTWQSRIQHRTFSVHEVARDMFRRMEEAADPNNPEDPAHNYARRYPLEFLEGVVRASLDRLDTDVATDGMKQKFLQSLGPLRRKGSENVRYTPLVEGFVNVSTEDRHSDSVSAAELRHSRTIFYTDATRRSLPDEQVEFFDEVVEPGAGFKCILVTNRGDFKTPLNLAIADHENERRFISMLLEPQNVPYYDCWLKSTSVRFYDIDFAWKKGEHPKRGKFSPDFFVRAGDLIVVIEVKGDDEIEDASDENRKKAEYAGAHFDRLNERLSEDKSPIRYKFCFLTPRNYKTFFQSLRDGKIASFRSELDVRLAAESD